MLQGILILVIFFAFAALMMTKKLQTIIALPLMGILIAFVAGVPFITDDPKGYSIAANVLEAGSMRLSSAIAGLIFGSFFGQVLNRVGIVKGIIKKAAELAGDKPLIIALILYAAASVIFAGSNGLGMVILVGTIIIPIMLTAGISPFASAIILLLANTTGGTFNVSGWAMYVDLFGLDIATISSTTVYIILPLIIAYIALIFYHVKGKKVLKKSWAMPTNENSNQKSVNPLALLSPIVPVVLVFTLNLSIVPAVIIGILVALLLTLPRNPLQVIGASFVEGLKDVAGAMGLMIGIGILLNAVMAPQVAEIIQPVIKMIIPTSPVSYVLIFTVLAPLALYRGPMNMWGLGSGIGAILVASGMNPVAAMVALRVEGLVQGTCDPTNTHNVWSADFTKTEVNDLTKGTIGWTIAAVVVSLTIASFMFFK
ncbi:MAG: citrate transporter [Coprobacillus sp.]